MNNKKILLIMSLFVIITFSSVVSAGLFDGVASGNANVKTHEFNYANKAVFNLSDELTNKTSVETILFGEGVSYEYPAKDGKQNGLVNMLSGLVSSGGSDTVEGLQNSAHVKELESEPTSQGYKTHIFKYDNLEQYEVYIDLNKTKIVEPDGYEDQYDYFTGTFQNLEEAKIFIKTFKINEDVIVK